MLMASELDTTANKLVLSEDKQAPDAADKVNDKKARVPLTRAGGNLLVLGRTTEETSAMRNWRQSELLYRALAERIRAVTYVVALDPGNPVLFVSSYLDNYGYAPERLVNNLDFRLQICLDEDSEVVGDAMRRALSGHESISCEYRLRCSNGEVRWVREEAHVVRDSAGTPILLQGMIVDTTRDKVVNDELNALRRNLEHQVSHRTRALQRRLDILESCNAVLCERLEDAHAQNEAWRQIQARYDYIMRLPGEAVVFIDARFQIVDLTEVACNLAGWDRVSAVQHHVQEVFQLADAHGRSWDMTDHLAELTTDLGADVCIKYLDGSLVPVRARLNTLGTGSTAREFALTLEKQGSDWSICGE